MSDLSRKQDEALWSWHRRRIGNPRIRELVEATVVDFDGNSDQQEEMSSSIWNLAFNHFINTNHSVGSDRFAEVASEMEAFGERARSLYYSMHRLSDGALTVIRYCELLIDKEKLQEAQLGDLHPWAGLPMPLEELPNGHPIKFNPPKWEIRMLALSKWALAVASWAKSQTEKGGRKAVTAATIGSPRLQLLRECVEYLAITRRDASRYRDLARVVEHLVEGRKPGSRWDREEAFRVDGWWKSVSPWFANQREAPEEIKELLERGPSAIPSRTSSKRPIFPVLTGGETPQK